MIAGWVAPDAPGGPPDRLDAPAALAGGAGPTNWRSAKPRSLLERATQAQVVDIATRLGYRAWYDVATNAPRACPACRAPLRGPRNPKGWPDLVLVRAASRSRDGRVVFVEVKRETTVLTLEQEWWRATLLGAGAEHYIWRPADLQAAAHILAAAHRPPLAAAGPAVSPAGPVQQDAQTTTASASPGTARPAPPAPAPETAAPRRRRTPSARPTA